MSIASDVQRIQQAKADIKTAIQGMGVTVPDTALISDLDTYVSNISSDANATVNDLAYGKTAYVGGTKITGQNHGVKTGSVTVSSNSLTLNISGLGFTPSNVIIYFAGAYSGTTVTVDVATHVASIGGKTHLCKIDEHSYCYSYNYLYNYNDSSYLTITFGDGTVTATVTSEYGYFYATTYNYIAW